MIVWGVSPDFLKIGKFTEDAVAAARQWCQANCKDKFMSSDISPWCFLSEQDAMWFSLKFGGTISSRSVNNE